MGAVGWARAGGAMGVNDEGRAALEARLAALSIGATTVEHPPAMTVDELLPHVGHIEGAHAKNLLLTDKKKNLYLVTALTDTKVDLRALSTRLGHGKSGVRMADPAMLGTALGVPAGCATPLAVISPGCKEVVLLIDQKFKEHKVRRSRRLPARALARAPANSADPRRRLTLAPSLRPQVCHFHPLTNDATTAISPADLERLVEAEGVTYAWVDLEAKAVVSKDSPPDLAKYVRKTAKAEGGAFGTGGSAADGGAQQQAKGGGKKDKKKGKKESQASKGGAERSTAADLSDVLSFVESLAAEAGLDARAAAELAARAEWRLQALKNGAFASGFKAGRGAALAAVQRV